MDSKAPRSSDPKPRMTRWLAYARSKASSVLKSERSPFDEGLKLNFTVPANPRPQEREAPMTESVQHLTKV